MPWFMERNEMITKETLDRLEKKALVIQGCGSDFPVMECTAMIVSQLITAARELESIRAELKEIREQRDHLLEDSSALRVGFQDTVIELKELRDTPIIGKPKMHRFPKHDSMIYEVEFKMKHFLDAATIGEAFDASKEKSK